MRADATLIVALGALTMLALIALAHRWARMCDHAQRQHRRVELELRLGRHTRLRFTSAPTRRQERILPGAPHSSGAVYELAQRRKPDEPETPAASRTTPPTAEQLGRRQAA